jgi:hypothetical protein
MVALLHALSSEAATRTEIILSLSSDFGMQLDSENGGNAERLDDSILCWGVWCLCVW